MIKVLVTGSAGFIGMHMALKLVREGCEVFGIDNLNEYYDVNLKYGRLKEQGIDEKKIAYGQVIEGLPSLRFMQVNLEDKEKLASLFESEKFDFVVHLAAQAGVRYSLENPYTYVTSNVEGFLNILEGCRQNPVKGLLYASSSSVYGLNTSIPFKESDATEQPVSLYAATKKANEMMAHSYAHLYNIPVVGLRFFTVYGPWGRPDMALFKFTKNILEDKPIDVYNYGEMQRDFTYVDDIVDSIFGLLENVKANGVANAVPESGSAPFSIFNIGNSNPVKLTDFVTALETVLNKKAKLNLMPLQPGCY